MRTGAAPLLVALALAAWPTLGEALDHPTVATTFQVEREQWGECTDIRAGPPGRPPILSMTHLCHGWSTSSCGDKILVWGRGVVEDRAQVIFTEAGKAVDLVPVVDKAIREQWPGNEHLHLQFGAASCKDDVLMQPFTGSYVKAGVGGSAVSMSGALRIIGPDKVRAFLKVAVRPCPRVLGC